MPNQVINFEKEYTKECTETYVKIPFEVPSNIDKITINYDYIRFQEEISAHGTISVEKNIIDIGLYDQENILCGWSGSNRKELILSSTSSTPGYPTGKIHEGIWAIALGLYKITDSVKVSITIELIVFTPQYLVGDLHTHTINSDGSYTVLEAIHSAKKVGKTSVIHGEGRMGLDFMAMTDHNITIQSTQAGFVEDIVLISGMEFTNYKGHANFFFPSFPYKFHINPLVNSFEEMKALFLKAKKEGAIISLNHPFCDNCPWKFGFEDFPFECVEVWNGPMKSADQKAIVWWHNQLCKGYKLIALAGSDFHKSELFRLHGSPANYIFSYSRTREGILEGIKNSSIFLSYTANGPTMDMHIGETILGGTVPYDPTLKLHLSLHSVVAGDIVRIISDKNSIEITVDISGTFIYQQDIQQVSFYRIELLRGIVSLPLQIVLLSNPIWIN